MHIEFKFSNDVFASVDLVSKTIYPYTKEMDGDFPCAPPIYYSTDDEMVDALKKVSEMVNLNQHRDVVDCMFDFYNGIEHCSYDGTRDGVMIWYCDNPETKGLKDALKDTGAVAYDLNEYGDGGLFTSVVVENNGTRIAKIIY
jgi:hypothetical protein